MRLLLLLGVAFVAALATSTVSGRAETDHGCNVRLKGLKTLSDPQRKVVNLHAMDTTVAAIAALPQPHPTPKTRSTAFSRQVWRVSAQITEFKLEGDSDIHLVLFGDGAYLIAEMPAARCIPKKARDRKAMIAVRKTFETRCGHPANEWRPLGAVVVISGVGSSTFHTPRTHTPETSPSSTP